VEVQVDSHARKLVDMWPQVRESYLRRRVCGENSRQGDPHPPDQALAVRQPDFQGVAAALRRARRTVALDDAGESARQLPLYRGVFAFKRENEDPTRMFAGEGDPFRTNRRFKKLSEHAEATRLSTAFDSVTLYGCDPTSGRTSTARSAIPACPSPPWTI
jgi:methylmalonyl-CoA mutase